MTGVWNGASDVLLHGPCSQAYTANRIAAFLLSADLPLPSYIHANRSEVLSPVDDTILFYAAQFENRRLLLIAITVCNLNIILDG